MTITNKKPEPLFSSTSRAVCPVCGETSYSCAGIHPQCAMLAADQVRSDRIKAQKRAEPETPKPLRWHEKPCPKCQAVQHVRKRTCECGYVFQIADRS